MKRILVTGATGFVGSVLCERLAASGYIVRAALRTERWLPAHFEKIVVGAVGDTTEWKAALEGIDAVVHLAARVHVLNDAPGNAEMYAKVNAEGTHRLAMASALAGVRRFIFLSSVKVNGEQTVTHTFSPSDEPAPTDAYGSSKWRGEKHLLNVASSSAMAGIIVRPPLIYGPGVRANFLRLMRWVDTGRPLPFGSIQNRRSLVSVWNLSDLVNRLLEHPAAAGRVWMASDGEDLSTPDLVRRIGKAMGRRTRLPRVPVGLLRAMGAMTGNSAAIGRLCGSLMVDISETRELLGWVPPLDVNEGIARTVDWYLTDGCARAS